MAGVRVQVGALAIISPLAPEPVNIFQRFSSRNYGRLVLTELVMVSLIYFKGCPLLLLPPTPQRWLLPRLPPHLPQPPQRSGTPARLYCVSTALETNTMQLCVSFPFLPPLWRDNSSVPL